VIKQRTLKNVIRATGVGIHSGKKIYMTLRPAAVNTGIVFRRVDLDPVVEIKACPANVGDTSMSTSLMKDGVRISTVEHLLSAFAGLGIDNAYVDVTDEEVPIMDGSSAVFCELMLGAGIKVQNSLRRRIRVLETIEVEDGVKWARLSPSNDNVLTLSAKIEFESKAIGTQQMSMRLLPGLFARDIAFARTFGFARDVEMLQSMGLARGGSLDNAVVIDGDAVMNPEGLRSDDEFIRHKLLDAVGDLMLACGPIAGIYEARQPGHAMNNKLVRALMDRPEAWCWETDQVAAETVSHEARL